jgi:hypothetical protein
MRYRGGGVGHTSTLKQTRILEEEALGNKNKGKAVEEVDDIVTDSEGNLEDDEILQVSEPGDVDEAEKDDVDEEDTDEDEYSEEDRSPSDWDIDEDEEL